ncbi:hypothetical protein [Actinotalea sp.]|uniref:hypothetical protein n=1 Tax=Actinotalea sp. TaxID=1872145 RepID=UPI003566510C
MRRRTQVLALTGAVAAVLAFPASASAAEADGCSGSFTSKDASGAILDTAEAPGEGATQDDPFQIDPDGTVEWGGSTDAVIQDGSWSVTIAGLPLSSGSVDNAAGETTRDGVQSLADLPGPATWALQGAMVIPVTGTITGTGGSCEASGFVTGTGSPTSSPIFFIGAGLGLVGLLMGSAVFAGTKVVPGGAARATAGGMS